MSGDSIFGLEGPINVWDKVSGVEWHGGRTQSRRNNSQHEASLAVEVRSRIGGHFTTIYLLVNYIIHSHVFFYVRKTDQLRSVYGNNRHL